MIVRVKGGYCAYLWALASAVRLVCLPPQPFARPPTRISSPARAIERRAGNAGPLLGLGQDFCKFGSKIAWCARNFEQKTQEI